MTEKARDIVWVSRAMMDSTLVKGLIPDNYLVDEDHAVDAMRRNEKGEPLPAERFPKELYVNAGKTIKRLPDICNAGGVWVVSAEFAAVLRGFDLGQSALYPVKVLKHNRKTPVEGEYFCINFGERKASFLPEISKAEKPYADNDIWKLLIVPAEDDIALDATALEGPDLWMENPRFRRAFFLSDRLVQALRAAKMTRRLGLRRCRVITDAA